MWKEKLSFAYPHKLEATGLQRRCVREILYPQKLEATSLSMLKQLLAQQLLDCILVDVMVAVLQCGW